MTSRDKETQMTPFRLLLKCMVLAALPLAAVVSQPAASPADLSDVVRPGDDVIVLRHGAAATFEALDEPAAASACVPHSTPNYD
jgi:hypothetical protein